MPSTRLESRGVWRVNSWHKSSLFSNQLASIEMDGMHVQGLRNNRNILAGRSVPILFIVVCFVIIASTRCDQVASTNAIDSSDDRASQDSSELKDKKTIDVSHSSASKNFAGYGTHDPLSFLREIYLDNNSKITTLFAAPTSESVQKFHPNGRYGRRSVNNFAEPTSAHVELGKLRVGGDQSVGSLKSLLHNFNRKQSADYKFQLDNQPATLESNDVVWSSDVLPTMDQNAELNKLLKCNFTGISNLYWCESGAN